jgi:uncharacterized protein YyaL (SSP411 family)
MKKLNNILISITFLAFIFINNAQAMEADWQPWSESILEQAEKENRLVFISLTAQWCQYCKKMDKTTYQDKAVIDELKQDFIAIKADEAKYPELAKKYGKVGRPGTIILDSKGKILMAKTGYLEPQRMLWMLQGTFADHTPAGRINE